MCLTLALGVAVEVLTGSYSSHLAGDQPVAAWVGSLQPVTYLTCFDGAPLDGMRCAINQMMTAGKDLFIDAKSAPAFENSPGKSNFFATCFASQGKRLIVFLGF